MTLIIDERTDKVGFRNIEFDAKKGFLINGKHVKLNGVCLHHDGGCVGAAGAARNLETPPCKAKGYGC
mgnify:CR=1 FL=1